MTDFKPGDRVRIVKDLRFSSGWMGMTGTVLESPHINATQVYADFNENGQVRPDGVDLMKFWWPDNKLELIPATNEDAKIEVALAQTKKDLGLCGGFDDAVEKARTMTFVDRLKHVAATEGRQDVFTHFEEILNKPEYVMPEVPKEGDYVRLTMKDGYSEEGEVKSTIEYQGHVNVLVQGSKHRQWIPKTQADADYTRKWDGPRSIIVKVEKIAKPVEIPEIGKWIEATDAAGTTKVIEVNMNNHTNSKTTWIGNGESAFDGFYARIDDAGKQSQGRRGRIVSWKYVDAPRNWKVGDVVPAGTRVGRKWLGEGVDNVAITHYNTDRKIVWIEEEKL